jgi:DNA-binding NarL/FixJ family response regulator
MRLVLVDDHPIFTESLGLLLQAIDGVEVVGELNDGSLLPEFLRNTPADIVICDIRMPGLNGIETTQLVKAEFPQVHVIMLSVEEDIGLVRGAILAGASGYLSKKVRRQELENALYQVISGQSYFSKAQMKLLVTPSEPVHDPETILTGIKGLSRREIEIVQLIAKELSNQEIAAKLYISVNTVESHRKNIYRKIGVNNTSGLIKFAIRQGLAPSD